MGEFDEISYRKASAVLTLANSLAGAGRTTETVKGNADTLADMSNQKADKTALEALVIGQFGTGFASDAMLSDDPTAVKARVTNIESGDADIMIKNNNELARFTNVEVVAGASVSNAITTDIIIPRGYVIVKANASHEWGARVERKMGEPFTFASSIDTIQAINPSICDGAIGDIIDLKGVALDVIIDNFDSVAHQYDIIVMGVAL
jgi:hypothetical protein